MNGTTITMATFTVTEPGLTPVLGAVSYDSVHNIAIFTPTNPLPDSAKFSATLTTGVMSAAEVPLASNFVWTFVASADLDTTAPTVLSTIPAALAPSVATNQKITATFSEPMDSTTVTATTFTLTGPGLTPVAGAVTYSTIGATATFTPTIALATGVTYTATITTGAADLAGVPFALDFAWTFTTGLGPDATAPSITLDTPTNGDSGVALNAGINATFSKAMDPATLDATTFTLAGPGPTPIDGKITYDVTNQIATFSPRSDLATGTTYTATVTTGAKDLEGNPLAADASWSFTTGSSPGLLPVDLGAASPFAIFAQATITNAGFSAVNGDIGLTPGTSVTGFTAGMVNGTIQIGTAPAIAALSALGTAYADAAGRAGPITIPENLATQVLAPGLYISAANSFEITGGTLTLDAKGDANGVWIFEMPASTLTLTAPSCSVVLVNGAQFANVFWRVGSSATLAAGCMAQGNIMADTTITLAAAAGLRGRAMAGSVTASGAMTLSANSVSTAGACSQ
jgi:hypothetical protein